MSAEELSPSTALSVLGQPVELATLLPFPNNAFTSENLGTETVTLNVGPEPKPFVVHKKLLCERCEYFSKSFNSDFEEAKTGIMNLPEDDEGAFTQFIPWLYSGTISTPPFAVHNSNAAQVDLKRHVMPLFILADKLCINDLMNRLIDLIQDFQRKGQKYFSSSFSKCVFGEIGPQSKLHMYFAADFADALANCTAEFQITRILEVHKDNEDFSRAVFHFQRIYGERVYRNSDYDTTTRQGPTSYGRCFFHTHAKGEVCHLDKEV